MILLLLAVLWIVVLAPGLIKKRREHLSSTSIDSFHHQLHLLERTGPKIVSPAYRLEAAGAESTSTSTSASASTSAGNSGLPAITSRPDRPKLVLVGRGKRDRGADAITGGEAGLQDVPMPGDSHDELPAPRANSDYARRQVLKRRRDIFLALIGTFFLTALLGVVPSLRLLWAVTVISGLALGGYIALMNYARRLRLERREEEWRRATRARSGSADRDRVIARSGPNGGWFEEDGYAEPQYALAGR